MNADLQPIAKGNPLWDFVTWAYAEPGVEKACLALQNRLGADINMVLFCVWLAYRRAGTSHFSNVLGAALKLSHEWQRTLVEPLRNCRQNLKDVIEASALAGSDRAAAVALRERIKQCEIDMERMQSLALCALVTDSGDRSAARAPAEQQADAHHNLTAYFTATGVKLDPLDQTHVIQILSAIFGA